jgi:outer membrane protein
MQEFHVNRFGFAFLMFWFTLIIITDRAYAEEWSPQGKWLASVRGGFSLLTQEVFPNTSSGVGSALNFQAAYGLNKMIAVGLMLEWERRGVDQERPEFDLGHVDTVSLLPTVEIRPGRFGQVMPYGSVGIGVNVNSFGESDDLRRAGVRVDPTNTFAFRLAGGVDIPVTSRLALNTELAWKRNRGGVEINDADGNFDASTFNFLFGARYLF